MSILPGNIMLPKSTSSGNTDRADSKRHWNSSFAAVSTSLIRAAFSAKRASRCSRRDLEADGPRALLRVDADEDQVRVQRDRALAGGDVLGPDAHADLQRRGA